MDELDKKERRARLRRESSYLDLFLGFDLGFTCGIIVMLFIFGVKL